MATMTSSRAGLVLTAALALGLGLGERASAQPVNDPIGAVLAASPPSPAAQPAASEDEEKAEDSGVPPPSAPAPTAGPTVVRPAAPAYTPYAPAPSGSVYAPPSQPRPYSSLYASPPPTYSRPPPVSVTAPVQLDETGRTPDRPLNAYDMSYDARLRASMVSAQGMLGPLDGGWTLSAPGRGDLYAFELVDKGGPLEGAWRDLRRTGALNASGFLEDVQRVDTTLTLQFSPREGGARTAATLTYQPDGRWTGEMVDAGGRHSVILKRN